MAKKRDTIPDPDASYEKAFRPIAIELGFLLKDWNDLQEILLLLFNSIAGFQEGKMASAIWHSVNNDRLQRKMLLRATSAVCEDVGASWRGAPTDPAFKKHLYKEVEWICKRADELGSQRDDAAHSPLAASVSERGSITYDAFRLSGHPRATNLAGKKLLKELKLYRDRADVLFAYVHEWLHFGSSGFSGPWPQTPEWPNHPPAKVGKNRRRAATPKARARRLRSSRA